MKFNFPAATKFIESNTMREQIAHCLSEGYEAISAIKKDEAETFESAVEIFDGLHGYETAIRKLINERGEEYVERARQAVIRKNDERGYYGA